MRFILDFVADTATATIDEYIAENNCTVIQTLSELGLIYLVECDSSPASEPFVEIIEDDPGGISLLDTSTKTFDIEDDDHWWKVAVIPDLDLGVPTAEIIRVGEGVRVYLLDSGIVADHPEFSNKDITLLHSKTGEFADSTGHGTALASVIVGETCGITEASLKVVKVFQQGQPTLVSEILTALNAVAEDFMLDATRPAIMNLSWAINQNVYVETKILSLINKGIIVIAAAGNSGVAVGDVSPARMPEVVTVGAFNQELTPSNFSNYTGPSDTSYTAHETNYGVGLDMFAPGEAIRVATTNGAYGYTAGTSIAAAITSAVTVVNMAALNSTYDLFGYDITLNFTREIYSTKNLLILEGNYASSPNMVPRARLKTFDYSVDPLPVVKPTLIIKSGEAFSRKLFNASYAKSATLVDGDIEGLAINGNWLTGGAVETDIFVVKRLSYEVTFVDDTVEKINVDIVFYNDSVYPEINSALLVDSGFAELDCGCPTFCCGVCNKSNLCEGGQCAFGGTCY